MQATLWKHASGIWYVRWSSGTGTRRASTGSRDAAVAQKFLEEFNARATSPVTARTVSDVLDRYEDDRLPIVRAKGSMTAATKNLRRHIGAHDPASMNNQAAREYAKLRKHDGVSDGTVIRELVTLRAALAMALAEGWLQRAGQFKMPVARPAPRDRWLTRGQADKLIAECRTPHLRLFVVLALSTGARREAILDLQWSGVDLGTRSIDYGRGHGNKRRAVVYVADDVADLLRFHMTYRTSDHVIEFDGRPIRSVRTSLDKAVARAGLDKLGTHVFRHTAATWAVMRGEPFERVAKMIGTSVEMVERVYGHHAPDYLRSTVTSGLVTTVTGGVNDERTTDA